MARWNGKSEVEASNFIFDQEAEDKNQGPIGIELEVVDE